ncbi:MAG: hypothetical protein RTV41_07020 [Candidatus Thorarchaeota archaeon]
MQITITGAGEAPWWALLLLNLIVLTAVTLARVDQIVREFKELKK